MITSDGTGAETLRKTQEIFKPIIVQLQTLAGQQKEEAFLFIDGVMGLEPATPGTQELIKNLRTATGAKIPESVLETLLLRSFDGADRDSDFVTHRFERVNANTPSEFILLRPKVAAAAPDTLKG